LQVRNWSSQKWVEVLARQVRTAARTGIIEEIWDSPEDSVLAAPMTEASCVSCSGGNRPDRAWGKPRPLRDLGNRVRKSRPFNLMAAYVRSRRRVP